MPAANEEIEALIHEGIEIQFLTTPVRFYDENGKLARMECIRMELGEPDSSGRRRPVPIKNSEFTTPVDFVITALGQAAQTAFTEVIGISLGKNGTIEVDQATGATNIEGVFAGGDVYTGPAYVVDAIAAGQRAAKSISQYLKGEPVVATNERKEPEKLTDTEVVDLTAKYPRIERIHMPEVNVEDRIKNFGEVATGYSTEAMARGISLSCGSDRGMHSECGECEEL